MRGKRHRQKKCNNWTKQNNIPTQSRCVQKENPQIVAKQSSVKTKQPWGNSVSEKHSARAAAALVKWQVSGRSVLSVGGRRGRFLFLCQYFLHPVDPVTGARAQVCVWAARRPRPFDRPLSLSQLEQTRAVHVTSHLAEQASKARGRLWGGLNKSLVLAYYLWDTPTLVPHLEERRLFVLSDGHKHGDFSPCVYPTTHKYAVTCNDDLKSSHFQSFPSQMINSSMRAITGASIARIY